MKLLVFLLVCCALAYGIIPGLPFPKCNRKGSNLAKCLWKRVEVLRPFLKRGIPEIHIPRLEPFKIRHLALDAEMSGLKLKGAASNIVAYGGSKFQIKSLKVDMKNYIIDVVVTIPNLDIQADYDSQGSKLFHITFNSRGKFKASLTDVTALITAQGHGVIKEGSEYFEIDNLKSQSRFGSGTLHVDPVNPSFKERTVAKLINMGSSKVLEMIAPEIDKAAAPIIKGYLSKVLNVVPLNDVLDW